MGSKMFTTKTHDQILIRPATFADLKAMAITEMTAYDNSPLEKVLRPLRTRYPTDALRMYYQRICFRWFDPRNLSFVACPASSPRTVVGYTQFQRCGKDQGARRQIESRRTVWRTRQASYYRAKFELVNYFWPDRSMDLDAMRKFEAWHQTDNKIHWKPFSERANRWHIQSLVVSPKWQRKGIGKRLIAKVLHRASKDRVVVGLEATADGEKLYRRAGFELLSRFTGDPIWTGEEGGVMMWKPERKTIECVIRLLKSGLNNQNGSVLE